MSEDTESVAPAVSNRIGVELAKARRSVMEAARAVAIEGEDIEVDRLSPKQRKMLMAVGRAGDRLRYYADRLPMSLTALYAISRLDDTSFQRLVEDGTINPGLTDAATIRAVLRADRRAKRERELADKSWRADAPLIGERSYGVLIADPPWRFRAWSDAGKNRSADNHYPVMTTEELAEFPMAKLGAANAVLMLWTTSAHLREGMNLLDVWGFEYRSCAVWAKPAMGMGRWFRQQCELVLIAALGQPPAPLPEDLIVSPFSAPPVDTRHSSKPATLHELAEKWWPNAAKCEIFARTARPGWDSIGNEAPRGE